MNNRQALAKSAATRALRIRAEVHAKPWDAIDVFDVAQQLGVEVRFTKNIEHGGHVPAAGRPRHLDRFRATRRTAAVFMRS